MWKFLNWLHFQVVYLGSAAVVAFLAVLMTSPSAQQPTEWTMAGHGDAADPSCLVDAATGMYAGVLEGQPVCTPATNKATAAVSGTPSATVAGG